MQHGPAGSRGATPESATELQPAPLHRQLHANFTLNTVTPALMESDTNITSVHLFDKETSVFQIT